MEAKQPRGRRKVTSEKRLKKSTSHNKGDVGSGQYPKERCIKERKRKKNAAFCVKTLEKLRDLTATESEDAGKEKNLLIKGTIISSTSSVSC